MYPRPNDAMAAKKKTIEQLEAELTVLRQSGRAQATVSIANNVVRWIGMGWAAYCAVLIARALAGQSTIAEFGLKLFANAPFANAVGVLFGGSGVAYGWRQKRLRQKTIERLSEPRIQLESLIDPSRSSSLLTRRGETPPSERH